MSTGNLLSYRKFFLHHGLEKMVKYAWMMRSEEEVSEPDLLIPDGYPELIFVLRGGYRKEFLDSQQNPVTIDRSCVIGIQSQSVIARRINQCHLIGVKLYPTAAYALLGNRLKEITQNEWLEKLGVQWLLHLDHQLQMCRDESSMIVCLSETLRGQVEQLERNQQHQLADAMLTSILASKGQISISELADQHYLSTRHFQRKFKEFFGITPKKFLNIIRFKQLYKSSILQQKLPIDFLKYGYYDQMHFIKDFQKHLGVNPSKSTETIFLQMNQMAKRNV